MVIGWFCAVLNRIYQLITMTRIKRYDCETYSIFDIKEIEELIECKITSIGVGVERGDIIFR